MLNIIEAGSDAAVDVSAEHPLDSGPTEDKREGSTLQAGFTGK